MEISSSNKPTMNKGEIGARPAATSSIKKLPSELAPYKKAIPSSIRPVEKAPIRKYFREASLLFRLRLSLPVNIYKGMEMISMPRNNISRVLNVVTRLTPQSTKKINAKYSATFTPPLPASPVSPALTPTLSISRADNKKYRRVAAKRIEFANKPKVPK